MKELQTEVDIDAPAELVWTSSLTSTANPNGTSSWSKSSAPPSRAGGVVSGRSRPAARGPPSADSEAPCRRGGTWGVPVPWSPPQAQRTYAGTGRQ